MSQICPQCGNDIYATSAEHRCQDFAMPCMRPMPASIDQRDAELHALKEQLAAVERERDDYKTRAQIAESSINRAVGAAHDSMPDYPWGTMRKGEELATACWAWSSTLKGTQKACDDFDAELSALRAELERKDAALKELSKAGQAMMDEPGSWQTLGRWGACIKDEADRALQPKDKPCQTA